MKAGRSEASTAALLEAGPNSGGQAGLLARAAMAAVRRKIEVLRLAAKAVEIARRVESGGDLIVAKHPSVVSLGKRRSHCLKSI